MATPPTLAADFSTGFDATLPNTVAVTAAAGRTLVAVGANSEWNTDTQNVSVPTGGTHAWTERYQHSTTGNACDIVAWTATSDGDYTHSQTSTGAGLMAGGLVWVYSGSDGFDAVAGSHSVAEPPTQAITTTTDNCAIIWCGADYQAGADAARAYVTINGGAAVEDVYFRDASYFTFYSAHWADSGTAGAKTAGLATADPAVMETSQVAVAIKGTAGGGLPASVPGPIKRREAAAFNDNDVFIRVGGVWERVDVMYRRESGAWVRYM